MVAINPRVRYWVCAGAGVVLGLILIVAGVGKLVLHTEAFRVFYTPHETFVPQVLADAAELWLPPVEVVVGLLLVLGVASRLSAIVASGLVVAFIANNGWLLSQGLGQESCGCFGILDTLSSAGLSTTGALLMDIGMLALGLVVVFLYPRGFRSMRPWFLKERQA